jgi:hypothetical protein
MIRVFVPLSNMSDGLFAAFKCSNTTFIMVTLVYENDLDYFV